MKVGILGSGFGLYGYLPAILSTGSHEIYLLEKYRKTLVNRPDIKKFDDIVIWLPETINIVDTVDTLVIAKRPFDQEEIIHQCLCAFNVKRIVLEKPLAEDPIKSSVLLDLLENSNKQFRIGYTFRETNWANILYAKCLSRSGIKLISVQWDFLSHHFANNIATWKALHNQGGGIIRFYGIQIIAILAEIGYSEILRSNVILSPDGEAYIWKANFHNKFLNQVEINVNSRARQSSFMIKVVEHNGDSYILTDIKEPFELSDCVENINSEIDRRSGYLARIFYDLINSPVIPSWYRKTNELWKKVENTTDWICID